jgi:NADPH:quinone reductase-like Zn-dependent oxidoreductase
MTLPAHALQLRSRIGDDARLEVSLVEVPVVAPQPDEVVIRVEAAPVNPSDLGLLFGAADLSTLVAGPGLSVTAQVPAAAMPAVRGRLGQSLAVGNEGAGTVVAAGSDPVAQALLGRTVAVMAGAMYSQYRTVRAADGLCLPPGTPAAAGASCFVNPLTALGMIETMRREGHRAIVHTAAASNLGQMLLRLCQAERIELVAIVRSPAQAALLRSLGAQHVVDSSSPTFREALAAALAATRATIAFDAIGGGRMAEHILVAMEAALADPAAPYSRYGTAVHKQVYLYGGLDTGPTEIRRSFGFAWGVGGWLLFTFLQRLPPQDLARLKQRVVDGLHTTFASAYARTVSLRGMLEPAAIAAYAARATGAKVLVDPQAG